MSEHIRCLVEKLDSFERRLDDANSTIKGMNSEVQSVLELMDGLAEQWGDEGVFRRCRDRLRALISQGKK